MGILLFLLEYFVKIFIDGSDKYSIIDHFIFWPDMKYIKKFYPVTDTSLKSFPRILLKGLFKSFQKIHSGFTWV